MVRARNSLDPGPVWLRQEAKRGAQWRLQPPIGEEIGSCSRQDGCFRNTARTDGTNMTIWQEKMNESLTTRGRKEAWFSGVGGCTSRTLRRSVRDAAPPPSVLRRHQPFTSRRGARRRFPTRRGPQCCGRGEAAGNCASAAGAFSTAFADRVPHVLGTRAAAAPEFLLRSGSTVRIAQDYKTRTELKGRRAQGGDQ